MTSWLCFCPPSDEDYKKDSEKKGNVDADKSASADVQTKATADEKTEKVAPLTADKSGSVRSKRTVKGEGKPRCVVIFIFKSHSWLF